MNFLGPNEGEERMRSMLFIAMAGLVLGGCGEVPRKNDNGRTSSTPGGSGGTAISGRSANADIVGLRLGMTPEEVRKTMLERDKNLRINEQQSSLKDLPSSSFLNKVTGELGQRLPVGPADLVEVQFPPPPHKSQAILIRRFTGFQEGKLPLISAIKEALIKKYGNPSFTREQGGRDISMIWAYDRSGAQIVGTTAQKCIKFGASPTQDGSNYFFSNIQTDGCGLTIHARTARKQLRGVTSQDLATHLAIIIIDDSAFPAMRAATSSYMTSKIRDSGSKVVGPKL